MIGVGTSGLEIRRTIEKINLLKIWFFEKIREVNFHSVCHVYNGLPFWKTHQDSVHRGSSLASRLQSPEARRKFKPFLFGF